MRALILLPFILLLTSCGNLILTRGDEVMVSQGFLADVGASAVTITTPNGTKIKSVQKDLKGTAVAKTGLRVLGLGVMASAASADLASTNALEAVKVNTGAATAQKQIDAINKPVILGEGQRIFTTKTGIAK